MNRSRARAAVMLASLCAVASLPAPASAQSDTPSSPDKGPAVQGQSLIVNLNTATAAQLQMLPGVGPARALSVLTLRKRLGGFRRTWQLLRVRGIGRKTYRKLRPHLTLKGPTRSARSKTSPCHEPEQESPDDPER